LGVANSFKFVLHERQAAEAENRRFGRRLCDVGPNEVAGIARAAGAKKRKRSIMHQFVEGCRRKMRRFRQHVRQRAYPRFVSLSRQLPRRYLELAREARYALRAEVTLHEAGRLTLPSFGSAQTRIIVTNNGGGAGYPRPKLLRSELAAEQIGAHQRISK
jgi:hypothetical protein